MYRFRIDSVEKSLSTLVYHLQFHEISVAHQPKAAEIGFAISTAKQNHQWRRARQEGALVMSNFTAHLYQTNASNASSGGGALSLTSSSGSFQGSVDWQITGVGKVAGKLSGKSVSNVGNLQLIDLQGTDNQQLRLTLVQNPYEGRVSYGGCVAYGGFIYNLTADAAS